MEKKMKLQSLINLVLYVVIAVLVAGSIFGFQFYTNCPNGQLVTSNTNVGNYTHKAIPESSSPLWGPSDSLTIDVYEGEFLLKTIVFKDSDPHRAIDEQTGPRIVNNFLYFGAIQACIYPK